VRFRLAAVVAASLARVLGHPPRVEVEVDRSLGGALKTLGLLRTPSGPRPARFLAVPENELARTAVLGLAGDEPGEFSRLVLLGAPGVGKSHLLRLFLDRRQRLRPLARTGSWRGLEYFQAFARAARECRHGRFRDEVLAGDALVLDDLEELAGKRRCQEQLVEVLECCEQARRPVLLATRGLGRSDREFTPRLRSVVAGSMTVALPELSGESRVAILRARCRDERVPDWLLEHLGTRTRRALDECLRLLAEVRLLVHELGRAPSRVELGRRFPGLLSTVTRPDPMDRILDRCAELVGASRAAIVAGDRGRAAALGRHLAIYLALEVFGLSQSTVRRWFGKLSPSVAPYVRRKIEGLRASQPRIDGFVREVGEEIGRGQRLLF
jgi:chromosomal replication initiator protein